MDINLFYRNFVVDDRELMFHSVLGTVPSFHDEEGNLYCAITAFQHPDADFARDPLSTNRRLKDTAELATFGTLVVAGSSPDHIRVIVPDTVGTRVSANSPLALQHVVGLRLGTAVDLSSLLPPPDLDRALCDNSVLPSLIRRRKAYWTEMNPILQKWQSVSTRKERPARLYGWTSHSHGNPDRSYKTATSSPTVLRLMSFDYSSVQRSGSSFMLTSTIHDLASTLHLNLQMTGYAESLRSTTIVVRIPHCGTLRRMSRRQIHCWLHLGYRRLHRQVPSSPLWPTHRHRLI